jgi:cation diffusion facilitator family transporter
MASSSFKKVIYAALFGNLAIALTKFGAAWLTGSSAMTSEAVHSLVDTGNEVLLLYGIRRGAQPPDEFHPLGHGRELYFWSFIVAVLVFALGAGIAGYHGIERVLHPKPIVDPIINYVVLGFSFLFEGVSWRIAMKEFRAVKGELGYFAAMRQSKDPTSFIVLLEDSAALLGVLIALIGTYASQALDEAAFDGVASIGIGVVLGATAIFLARETKGLLIGESAHPGLTRSIRRIASEQPGIERVNELFTIHLAPRQVVAMLNVHFANTLTAGEVEAAVDMIERRIKSALPEVEAVFVKPQSTETYRDTRERRISNQ